jgi:hypothetical protein
MRFPRHGSTFEHDQESSLMAIPGFQEEQRLLILVLEQIRRHPGFDVEDLYKGSYHACCGGEHALAEKRKSYCSLLEEWKALSPFRSGESLMEAVDPRDRVIRVNLRPYRQSGGNVRTLWACFRRSAVRFEKDHERLQAYGYALEGWAEKGRIPFSPERIRCFWEDRRREGFPPSSHSSSYAENNRPAYRIVLKTVWLENDPLSSSAGRLK